MSPARPGSECLTWVLPIASSTMISGGRKWMARILTSTDSLLIISAHSEGSGKSNKGSFESRTSFFWSPYGLKVNGGVNSMLTSGGSKRTKAPATVQGTEWGGCRVFMHICGNATSMLVALYFCRIHNSSVCVGSRNTLSSLFQKVKGASSWQWRLPKLLKRWLNDWSSGSFNVQCGGCLVLSMTGDFRVMVCILQIDQQEVFAKRIGLMEVFKICWMDDLKIKSQNSKL